MSSARTPA
jgi:hypothetical protein